MVDTRLASLREFFKLKRENKQKRVVRALRAGASRI